ncbi:xanthosine triphosphate pyrophosphatase [Bradyrhizobium sp. CCBAU 65884]|uniref:non-canonical purine NTP pyrophosphatase n=1 Tax=Bradyrhizobium sp. CCBAU 65884 TaxID=722477 RepID=UPI002305DE95|nr:non-canonical purine NTP pyrophosphatase [Bradyrhizobium sp. CCBAU 65884]MDA9478255.1 xanthosine triphosphate pyrophosphatase [Bradyrhizobium sp. CCBAU 65884]
MRPQYGNALRFDRVLTVYFYTSNADKLLQAKLMFMRHGYALRHYRGRREPYDEDYSLETRQLLDRAIEQVNAEFGVRSIFFVEDTSLRIEALSEGATDYPGLAVKEWFSSASFEALDRELRKKGNDRRVVVKSDIALYLPTLSRKVFFHGETEGAIATSPPAFSPSAQYPWLTPDTFNGWFIPQGATKRLGEMEFEESLTFDFRAKSLSALISRLEELNLALNIPPNFYIVRRPALPPIAEQQLLFKELMQEDKPSQVLVVIGNKCAGKTTLSDYLIARDDVMVFEASSVLRSLASEADEQVETADDAYRFLFAHGLDCVAHTIAKYIERSPASLNVVTGLRTVEEVSLLVERFPSARIVFVDADVRTRFERHVRRARDKDVKTFVDFVKQDEQQARFGVLRVPTEIATDVVRNDGTLELYKERIDSLIVTMTGKHRAPTQSRNQKSELYRTLNALRALGSAATCAAISEKAAELGTPVRKYNTNRALKAVPEFAERVKRSEELLRYKLTARGEALLQLLEKFDHFQGHRIAL